MDVGSRIAGVGEELTPAERRVADVVLNHPEVVAFGTVADLGGESRAGGATVLRLAAKLGYAGFSELQTAVQHELARRLRPAAERIRQQPAGDPIGRSLAVELGNVGTTLEGVDVEAFDRAVARVAGASRVLVLSGDASRGIAMQVAGDLGMLREGVELLDGNEVAVLRTVSGAGSGDVCLAIDLRRYDRWVVDTARRLRDRGVAVLALTDGALSPVAAVAEASFVLAVDGVGPFDSHVGTLALANAIVAGTADRLRASATERLDRLETCWHEVGALVEP